MKPKHDWASHGSDAFRTFGVGFREKIMEQSAIEEEIDVDPYSRVGG